MLALIFETWPAKDKRGKYRRGALASHAATKAIGGLVSVDRFERLCEGGKPLSLQFWRGQDASTNGRADCEHRMMQAAGRTGLCSARRLGVASLRRDYGMTRRTEPPASSITAKEAS